MANGGVAVPTLVTYEALAEDGAGHDLPPDSIAKIETVRANGLGSLAILREAGVIKADGTDPLGPTHTRQSQEFAIRARVLPAREIFASATLVAAELCGSAGRIGVVAPGAQADLLVVEGEPLSGITALADSSRSIRPVMKGGGIHRRHDL